MDLISDRSVKIVHVDTNPMEKCSFGLASLFGWLGGALQILLMWRRSRAQPILFCSRFCCWYICHFQLDFLKNECGDLPNLSFFLQMTVERKSKSSCRWKSKECWLCQLGCKRVEAFAISTQRLASVQTENWELFIGKKTSIPLLNPTVSQMQPRRNCFLHSLAFQMDNCYRLTYLDIAESIYLLW